MVEAYRHHTELLQHAGERGRHFLPGFIRYEENLRWNNRSHCLWGTSDVFLSILGYSLYDMYVLYITLWVRLPCGVPPLFDA